MEPIIQSDAIENEMDTGGNTTSQARKSYSVDSFFKDRRFSGYPQESIEQTLVDCHICFVLLQLTNRDRSLFFVNALSGAARVYFLRSFS